MPWHPPGRLKLQLTGGHGLLLPRPLGPQPLRPEQAHTQSGPVQAARCDWLPITALDALSRPPGVGWAVEGWSLPEWPQHQQVLLAVLCVWTRLWPGSCSPACPKAVAVARRAQEIQWAWAWSSLPSPGCPLSALHSELGTLDSFWSPGPEHLLAGLRRPVATAVTSRR